MSTLERSLSPDYRPMSQPEQDLLAYPDGEYVYRAGTEVDERGDGMEFMPLDSLPLGSPQSYASYSEESHRSQVENGDGYSQGYCK